jgi:hypothetical protein
MVNLCENKIFSQFIIHYIHRLYELAVVEAKAVLVGFVADEV